MYNLCRVFKTDISAVLTVISGLDPHMIIELEESLNPWCFGMCWFLYDLMLKWVGINLYLEIRCLLIKFDQLKC